MVEVNLWSGLRPLADGKDCVEVEATTVRDMLSALVDAYPGLKPAIDAGVSIAMDGRIVTGGLNETLDGVQEVYLLQRLKGG
ncbi:ThiS family protein [Aliiruegeria haliotis]|uniref:ThiS family protein n=1 Tax=Aliiruegeria haliotis TaxID=1280846 RepID=A0A2T0RT88_9RHOB|nr:MoaD/ThiS family protein [Aliiruegeria haliotis]PRY24419.1 ThiS family protein [Aliiruegeria haliotis]